MLKTKGGGEDIVCHLLNEIECLLAKLQALLAESLTPLVGMYHMMLSLTNPFFLQ